VVPVRCQEGLAGSGVYPVFRYCIMTAPLQLKGICPMIIGNSEENMGWRLAYRSDTLSWYPTGPFI